MLVAACLALVRGVNDICKVDPEDPEAVEGCEGTSRWAGAWQILTEGWAEARRAATEGFEAIKQVVRVRVRVRVRIRVDYPEGFEAIKQVGGRVRLRGSRRGSALCIPGC